MTRRAVQVLDLGRISYQPALEIQHKFSQSHLDHLAARSDSPAPNTLLVLEHNPVYTVGIRTKGYTHEYENQLKSLGADFYKTNRGGLITFHGPGQLVVYPILNLKEFGIGMRSYVCKLERTIINTCAHFGVTAITTQDTGVWIGDNKICALGVHGRRYVTTHGIALNCNNDLSWFEHIVPCGIEGKGVTSLTNELKQQITVNDALLPFLHQFAEQFNCNITKDNKLENIDKDIIS